MGKEAPSSSSVELGAFVIKGPSGALVESLSLDSDTTFPVSVAAGDDKTVRLTLKSDALVDSAAKDALCAGEVWFTGDVIDASNGGKPTPVAGDRFQPTCE